MTKTANTANQVSLDQFAVTGAIDGASKDVPVGGGLRPQLDTRLVAAVQRGAGARCHEAAGLLHQYYLCLETCWVDMDSPETGYTVTPASWAMLQRTKGQLRALVCRNSIGAGLL